SPGLEGLRLRGDGMSLLVLIDPPDRRAWRHDEVFRGVLGVPDLHRVRRQATDPGWGRDEESKHNRASRHAPHEPPESWAAGARGLRREPSIDVHVPCERLDGPDVP